MRRQRNKSQMKEQIKTLEKEQNKMEISNLSDAEFKTLIIRKHKELSEDLSSIKSIQLGMKNMLIQLKNTFQGNNSKVDETKSQIHDLEHKKVKNNHIEQQEAKDSLQNKDTVSCL